jgi:hypothetical protein
VDKSAWLPPAYPVTSTSAGRPSMQLNAKREDLAIVMSQDIPLT